MKKGISLIVLVITIVVALILLSAVVLNFRDENVSEKATEVQFKNNIRAYQDELNMFISDQKLEAAKMGIKYNIDELNATKTTITGGVTVTTGGIDKIISSMKSRDLDRFEIQSGSLVYIEEKFIGTPTEGAETDEYKWLKDMDVSERKKLHLLSVIN